MKKTVLLFLVSAGVFFGCHSPTPPGNATANKPLTDTTKMTAVQQPVDTSAKDGTVIKHYPNGVIKERSFYVGGRRRGECQYFYPNGRLWSDEYFINGILDGSTTNYFDNGQKRYEGTFTKGKPSGIWKIYDNTGKLTRTIDYDKKQNNPSI
jgi:antitoxin component YwqK of YwqJK toxin-antitoxin module